MLYPWRIPESCMNDDQVAPSSLGRQEDEVAESGLHSREDFGSYSRSGDGGDSCSFIGDTMFQTSEHIPEEDFP